MRRSCKRFFARLSQRQALAFAVALNLLVAIGDDLTGADVSFTVLYLVPIAFATWFVSRGAGVGLSMGSAVASFAVDLATRVTPLAPGVLLWNFAVQLAVFFALTELIVALKKRLAREQQLARTDALTMVSNRRAFLELASIELERARRTGQPITVAYLDADDFKFVNDRLGHAEGDRLLVTVAATLRGATRAVDTVARLGGDEFGLLLVDTDGPTAEALLARLRSTLAAAMGANGWQVTFSVGAATFLTPSRSVDEMLGIADQLMYEAKHAGKDEARLLVLRGLAPPVNRAAT